MHAFANGVYMDTKLDDKIAGNLLRLDAFQTLQPRSAVLPFNGRLIARCRSGRINFGENQVGETEEDFPSGSRREP